MTRTSKEKMYIVTYWSYLDTRACIKTEKVLAKTAQNAVNAIRKLSDYEEIMNVALECTENWI